MKKCSLLKKNMKKKIKYKNLYIQTKIKIYGGGHNVYFLLMHFKNDYAHRNNINIKKKNPFYALLSLFFPYTYEIS